MLSAAVGSASCRPSMVRRTAAPAAIARIGPCFVSLTAPATLKIRHHGELEPRRSRPIFRQYGGAAIVSSLPFDPHTPPHTRLQNQKRYYREVKQYRTDSSAVDFSNCPPEVARRVLGGGVNDETPSSSSCCVDVFPSVMSPALEDRVWGELTPLLEKHGDKALVGGSNNKTRSISLDMHGLEAADDGGETTGNIAYHDAVNGGTGPSTDKNKISSYGQTVNGVTLRRDWAAGGRAKQVFDLSWVPTLQEWCKTTGRDLLSTESNEVVPDSIRVVEHHAPGDDFVVQPSCVGSQYLILNLVSQGIVNFDNESEQAEGRVLLDEGSCVRVSGGVRWGWRVGQRAERRQPFCRGGGRSSGRSSSSSSSSVDCSEFRVSIMIYKYDSKMADATLLADQIMDKVSEHHASSTTAQPSSAPSTGNKQSPSGAGDNEGDTAAMVPPELRSSGGQNLNSVSGTDDKAFEEAEARAALAQHGDHSSNSNSNSGSRNGDDVGETSQEAERMRKIASMSAFFDKQQQQTNANTNNTNNRQSAQSSSAPVTNNAMGGMMGGTPPVRIPVTPVVQSNQSGNTERSSPSATNDSHSHQSSPSGGKYGGNLIDGINFNKSVFPTLGGDLEGEGAGTGNDGTKKSHHSNEDHTSKGVKSGQKETAGKNPAIDDPLADFIAYKKRPESLDEAMADVGDYRNRLARLGTFMQRYQDAHARGQSFSREQTAEELRGIAGDDSLNQAMEDPSLQAVSFEEIAEKAEYVLGRFKEMDYYGGATGSSGGAGMGMAQQQKDAEGKQQPAGDDERLMRLRTDAETIRATASGPKEYFRKASEKLRDMDKK